LIHPSILFVFVHCAVLLFLNRTQLFHAFVVNYFKGYTKVSLYIKSIVNNQLCNNLQSEITQVRSRLVRKLHRGLITLRLPLSFASLLCLTALWNEPASCSTLPIGDLELTTSDVQQMIMANVVKRRQMLSIRASSFDGEN